MSSPEACPGSSTSTRARLPCAASHSLTTCREEIASDGELAPGVVDDAEIHAEVVGQRSAVPRVRGNGFADAALNEAAEFVFE